MKSIENLKDLRSERTRLKLKLNVAEETLRDDVEWIKTELKPVHLVGRFINNSLVNKDWGLVNGGVRDLIDSVLKTFVLPKSGWIVKLIVPFILKNISSNYILEKKPEFFGMIKRLISKARRSTNANYQHNGHDHYDKSTVDEMDY
jgi:hypothetical protein